MNTDVFLVLNGLGYDNHHFSSFVFIDLPLHVIFSSIFSVDPISTKTITDCKKFSHQLFSIQVCWKLTCFHRKSPLKWLNTEHLYVQPAVNRETQFLNQVFNMSSGHVKWRFSLVGHLLYLSFLFDLKHFWKYWHQRVASNLFSYLSFTF